MKYSLPGLRYGPSRISVVTERRFPIRVRFALLVVLMSMIISFAPRAALASGCHVEERPVFGLTRAEVRDDTAVLVYGVAIEDDVETDWAPRPCSDGSDANPPQAMALPAMVDAVLPRIEERPSTWRSIPENSQAVSRDDSSDLSRPPRSGASAL